MSISVSLDGLFTHESDPDSNANHTVRDRRA